MSGQAEPLGRAVDEGAMAGRAAQGQEGISGTKEPQLFLPEHFHLKMLHMGVGEGEARSDSQKIEGKADACLGQGLN